MDVTVGMTYAAGCLLLLLVALSVGLLFRFERFENPPIATMPVKTIETNTIPTVPATTLPNTASPSTAPPVAAGTASSTPAEATASVPREGAPSVNASLLSALFANNAISAPTAPVAVPDASNGSQSLPQALGPPGRTDAGGPDACNAKIAEATQPFQDTIDALQRKNAQLESKAKEPVQRCPDMKEYVRRDSIPCYNCTL